MPGTGTVTTPGTVIAGAGAPGGDAAGGAPAGFDGSRPGTVATLGSVAAGGDDPGVLLIVSGGAPGIEGNEETVAMPGTVTMPPGGVLGDRMPPGGGVAPAGGGVAAGAMGASSCEPGGVAPLGGVGAPGLLFTGTLGPLPPFGGDGGGVGIGDVGRVTGTVPGLGIGDAGNVTEMTGGVPAGPVLEGPPGLGTLDGDGGTVAGPVGSVLGWSAGSVTGVLAVLWPPLSYPWGKSGACRSAAPAPS